VHITTVPGQPRSVQTHARGRAETPQRGRLAGCWVNWSQSVAIGRQRDLRSSAGGREKEKKRIAGLLLSISSRVNLPHLDESKRASGLHSGAPRQTNQPASASSIQQVNNHRHACVLSSLVPGPGGVRRGARMWCVRVRVRGFGGGRLWTDRMDRPGSEGLGSPPFRPVARTAMDTITGRRTRRPLSFVRSFVRSSVAGHGNWKRSAHMAHMFTRPYVRMYSNRHSLEGCEVVQLVELTFVRSCVREGRCSVPPWHAHGGRSGLEQASVWVWT
jgi:hypothetical protein